MLRQDSIQKPRSQAIQVQEELLGLVSTCNLLCDIMRRAFEGTREVIYQQSVISLEILESPFFKKRWFLEHLELI